MKLNQINRNWRWAIAWIAFFVAVLTCQQYFLYDIEQSRVLVYESDKITEQVMKAGGIADFIALFLQQFFIYNVAAAAIMATLFVLTSFSLHKVYSYAVGRQTTLAEDTLCCLPACLLFVYTEGLIIFITGHVAISIASLALLAGVWLLNRNTIVACALLPILILFVGFATSTAVWPMVIALILYSLLYKRSYIAAVVIAASAALMVALARYTCLALTENELFMPDIYSYRLRTETTMKWIWLTMITVSAVPFLVRRFVSEKVIGHIATAAVMLALVTGVTYKSYQDYHDDFSYERLRLQHWLDTGDYALAQEYCSRSLNTATTSNIYFMIESFTGDIEQEVGGVLTENIQLVASQNSIPTTRRHLMSLYYYLGYVNGAQREAFEYNEPSEGMMVPAAVKILALTNIIQGNYAVAGKYIDHLSHTIFYRDWAEQYRHFLYNDKAVEADPELGPRRKALDIESIPQSYTTIPYIIRQIAYTVPELPAQKYMKAFTRLGEYSKNTYEAPQQSFIY